MRESAIKDLRKRYFEANQKFSAVPLSSTEFRQALFPDVS